MGKYRIWGEMFNCDINVIMENLAAIGKTNHYGQTVYLGKYRKWGELFNCDINVILEIVAAIGKNKSIGTDSIYVEIQKMRGTVQQWY
jgi:hypothetical protein